MAMHTDGEKGLCIAARTIGFAKKSIFSNGKLELETSNSLFSNVVYSGISNLSSNIVYSATFDFMLLLLFCCFVSIIFVSLRDSTKVLVRNRFPYIT